MLFPSKLPIDHLREDQAVVEQATQIFKNSHRGDRTEAQHWQNALLGTQVEEAARRHLRSTGYSVLDPTDKTHDLRIQVGGRIYEVDVKSVGGKANSVTLISRYERQLAKPDVIYLVFPTFNQVAYYRGWCSRYEFVPSKYDGKGPYVMLAHLHDDDPFV